MPAVFLTSDTHFGHLGVCVFTGDDGEKIRPWTSPEEMDEEMVKRWNETVRPNDKVYHLGDVVINRKALNIMHRLNGDKVLIRGNHDTERISLYRRYFRDIRAVHVHEGAVMSHIPIHPDCIGRFSFNIHGHTHYNHVMRDGTRDFRYVNVCVEHTGYRPVLLNWVLEEARKGLVK
jgi:calcineurin-like phosphoesterase family protein